MQSEIKKLFLQKILAELSLLFFVILVLRILTQDFWFYLVWCLCVFIGWHYFMSLQLINAIFTKKILTTKAIGVWKLIQDEYNYKFLTKKNQQKELIQLIASFKYALNKLKQGILICNKNHTIIWCNKSANSILNLHYQKKGRQNLLHLQHHLNFRNFVESLVLSNNFTANLEIQKQEHHYKIRGFNFENHYFLFIENITSTEVAKLRQNKMLSYINHDLRTPLTVMSGYLEMLSEDASLLDKVLEPIRDQSNKIKHLLEELNELSSLSESKPLSQNWCNFSQMLINISKDVQKIYPNYPLQIKVQENISVIGEELNLNRLVTNLIYNAIKHNPEGTQISIELQISNQDAGRNGIIFSVKDTGVGIDKEDLPYLTVRFYRGDKARGTQGSQNGLGLAIVKHILEKYDSKLEIKSQKFIGSEFSFHLKPKFIQTQNPNGA